MFKDIQHAGIKLLKELNIHTCVHMCTHTDTHFFRYMEAYLIRFLFKAGKNSFYKAHYITVIYFKNHT